MAVIRLFAQAREAAGRGVDEIEAATLDALLDTATRRYGPDFAAVLPLCRVWINGEPAEPAAVLSGSDEVALLPPVSGG